MKNFKYKKRIELLEQKIQELDTEKQKELFKQIGMKKETLFQRIKTGKMKTEISFLLEEKLNLTREQLLFIFFEEEVYSKEQKQSDFEFIRNELKGLSKEGKAFIEGMIAILNQAKTIDERDSILNKIKIVLSQNKLKKEYKRGTLYENIIK